MQYNPPVNAPDPNASYINANVPAGVQGSSPPAEAIEYDQREIVNAISLGGLVPANSDLTQLWQVINNAAFNYEIDVGTPNNVIISPTPALGVYKAGRSYAVKVAANNSGASTMTVSGLPARPIVHQDQSPLVAGDMITGGIGIMYYDGVSWQLLTSANALVSSISLIHSGIDTGVANAYVANVTPGISSYQFGLFCEIFIAHTNTGASTINLNGLGVKPLTRNTGAALQAGDVNAGGFAIVAYDGTNWELLNPQIPAASGSSLDESITGPLRPYFIAVNSATTTSPPSSPAVGDTYLVPVGATGAWSGLGNQVTQWTGLSGGWHTVNMPVETCVGVADQDDIWKRTSTGWRTIFASLAEAAAGIAINLAITPADLRQAASILGPLRPPWIAVNSATVTTPPGSPALGDTYVVPTGATGAWSGFINSLAQWNGSTWLFRLPPARTVVGCTDSNDTQFYTGSGWRSFWASLAEALAGTSTVLGITPADLAYVLSQQQGQGDDYYSDLFYYGCF